MKRIEQGPGATSNLSLITVGILVYNSATSLPSVLNALRDIRYDPQHLRIVFVDCGSTDGSLEVIQEFVHSGSDRYETTRVEHCEPSISKARNICLRDAEGTEFIFFLDSDVIPPPDVVTRLLAHFATIENVGIASVPCDHENARDRAKVFYRAFDTPIGPTAAGRVGAGCTLISMRVAGIVGDFNEGLKVHEDTEYCYRVTDSGFIVLCDHSFRAFHLHRIHAGLRYYLHFISDSAETYGQLLKLRSTMHFMKYATSILLILLLGSFLLTGIFYYAVAFLAVVPLALWANTNPRVLDDGARVKPVWIPLIGAILTVFVVVIVWTSLFRAAFNALRLWKE